MQVKSIAECSAILLTFTKLPFSIKTFVLYIFEWPLKTGFTVCLLWLTYLFLNFIPSFENSVELHDEFISLMKLLHWND